MTDKTVEWDKLPAEVEAPGFKKATGEFTFTIVTPKKYEDHAKAFMDRVSSLGVFFFAPCALDQIDALLEHNGDMPAKYFPPLQGEGQGGDGQSSCLVSVEVLAQVLGLEPRTVQLDVEKGLLIRTVRGQYDTLASCGTLRKALKDAEAAQGDALRSERVLITRAKREAVQLDNFERAKKLGNCEECIKVRIMKNANIKQRILAFEKVLPQKTGGRTAEEQVPIIRNEIRKLLTDLAATERPVGDDSRSGQDIPSASGLHGEPVGRRKAKAGRKN